MPLRTGLSHEALSTRRPLGSRDNSGRGTVTARVAGLEERPARSARSLGQVPGPCACGLCGIPAKP